MVFPSCRRHEALVWLMHENQILFNGPSRQLSESELSCPLGLSTEMRGYHIRIIVEQNAQISSSQPQAADSFLPSHLFQHLPAHKPRPTNRRNATFNSHNKDYRFGPLRVDWVDFENMSRTSHTVVKEKNHGRGMPNAIFSPKHL